MVPCRNPTRRSRGYDESAEIKITENIFVNNAAHGISIGIVGDLDKNPFTIKNNTFEGNERSHFSDRRYLSKDDTEPAPDRQTFTTENTISGGCYWHWSTGGTRWLLVPGEVIFSFTGLESGVKAGLMDVTINTRVTGFEEIAGEEALRYKIVLLKDGLPLAGLKIKYPEVSAGDDPEDPETWSEFTTDEDGITWFGPKTGFELADLPGLAGTDGVTTPFQVSLGAGSYRVRLALVDITAGAESILGFAEKAFTLIGDDFVIEKDTEIKTIEGDGQTLNFASGVVITLEKDAGAVAVTRYTSDDKGAPAGMLPAGIYLRLERSVNLAGTAVRIEVAYDLEKLPQGVSEGALKLYRYNEATQKWDLIAKQGIDKTNKILWAELDNFSTYGIFAASSVEPEPGKELPPAHGGLPYFLVLALFMIAAGFLQIRVKGLLER